MFGRNIPKRSVDPWFGGMFAEPAADPRQCSDYGWPFAGAPPFTAGPFGYTQYPGYESNGRSSRGRRAVESSDEEDEYWDPMSRNRAQQMRAQRAAQQRAEAIARERAEQAAAQLRARQAAQLRARQAAQLRAEQAAQQQLHTRQAELLRARQAEQFRAQQQAEQLRAAQQAEQQQQAAMAAAVASFKQPVARHIPIQVPVTKAQQAAAQQPTTSVAAAAADATATRTPDQKPVRQAPAQCHASSTAASSPAEAPLPTPPEAATTIQSLWRMQRLAPHRPALRELARISREIQALNHRFQTAKEESGGSLSHKQYLELNEVTMRVLLQLDATLCGVTELRLVRKRLSAQAIQLLDEVQAAYSNTVRSASAEVGNKVVAGVVKEAVKAASSSRKELAAGPAEDSTPVAAASSSVRRKSREKKRQGRQQKRSQKAAWLLQEEEEVAAAAADAEQEEEGGDLWHDAFEQEEESVAATDKLDVPSTPTKTAGEAQPLATAEPTLLHKENQGANAAGSGAAATAETVGKQMEQSEGGVGPQGIVGGAVMGAGQQPQVVAGPAEGVRVILLYPGQTCTITS